MGTGLPWFESCEAETLVPDIDSDIPRSADFSLLNDMCQPSNPTVPIVRGKTRVPAVDSDIPRSAD